MVILKETEKRMIRIFIRMSKLGAGTLTLASIIASEIVYFIIAFSFGFYKQPNGYISAFVIPLLVAYPTISLLLKITKIVQAQNEDIELKNELKNNLLSVVSHDVRGPLASIDSLLNVYFQELVDQQELNKLLKDLQQQVKNNLDFVTNILHWTKTQFDSFHVIKTSINMDELIHKMIGAYDFQIHQKKLILKTDTKLTLESDRDLLRLILRNLLSNAIKFSKPGGEIFIGSKIENNRIVVRVTDNGVGMDEEKLNGLFDENLHKPGKGTYSETGTGLGLKLCKTFIDALGGRIWAESKVGEGTSFYFTIPL